MLKYWPELVEVGIAVVDVIAVEQNDVVKVDAFVKEENLEVV